MLEVTYWVDVPGGASTADWQRVWTAAGQAGDSVPGIGDGAFFNDGRLTFEQDNVYFTLAINSIRLKITPTVGGNQTLDLEKQLALDILNQLSRQPGF
ncbi:MAG: hypothetical protein M1281_19915 [Chloroflexi bacterium]|nr:hypothetical protein [Chloroflexota bacterium]